MTKYVVKHHKGHSGKSVYEWRVYAIYANGSKYQLAKLKSKAAADAFCARLAALP